MKTMETIISIFNVKCEKTCLTVYKMYFLQTSSRKEKGPCWSPSRMTVARFKPAHPPALKSRHAKQYDDVRNSLRVCLTVRQYYYDFNHSNYLY